MYVLFSYLATISINALTYLLTLQFDHEQLCALINIDMNADT